MLSSENRDEKAEINTENEVFVFRPEHIIKVKKVAKWDKFLSNIRKSAKESESLYIKHVKKIWSESKNRIIAALRRYLYLPAPVRR